MVTPPEKSGFIRPYSGILGELFRIGDLVLIFSGLWFVAEVLEIGWHIQFILAGGTSLVLFMVFSQVFSLYGTWRVTPIRAEVFQLWLVWIVVLFCMLLIAYATKTSSVYSRRVVLSWMFLTPALLSLYRIIVRVGLHRLREAGRNLRIAAIAGQGEMAERLSNVIQTSPWLGLSLQGIYSSNQQEDSDDLAIGQIRGELATLMNKAKNNEIDVIFLALPAEQQSIMEILTTELADTTASVYFIPNFFMTDLLHAKWGYIDDIPYLSLRETPFYGVDGTLKRIEDVVISCLILLITIIPMVIIAILVKLTSKGPVLFRQKRYGLDGKPIEVWKFRSMSVMEDGEDIPQAKKDDPRLTPIGAFLRGTSMDELPQFFNVLQGSMSIVGPRPHAIAHNEEYRKIIYGYMLRHKVKPGITGWAQINGWRGETDTLDKMKNRVDHDMWYIRNWSIWLDIKIIFLTILRGFTGKNVY
jgi:putative colanic acid biosynthesis UDP-glucose lipid carrier transferase